MNVKPLYQPTPNGLTQVEQALDLSYPLYLKHDSPLKDDLAMAMQGRLVLGRYIGINLLTTGYGEGHRVHAVYLNPYMAAEDATASLWHEATHAKQREAFANQRIFETSYGFQNQWVGYRDNPYEKEAREIAHAAFQQYPSVFDPAPRELTPWEEPLARMIRMNASRSHSTIMAHGA